MLGIIGIVRVHAAETANPDLERKFSQTVRPFLASAVLAVALWLVFHDRSVAAAQGGEGVSRAATPVAAARLSPRAPSRTPARTVDPASSRS